MMLFSSSCASSVLRSDLMRLLCSRSRINETIACTVYNGMYLHRHPKALIVLRRGALLYVAWDSSDIIEVILLRFWKDSLFCYIADSWSWTPDSGRLNSRLWNSWFLRWNTGFPTCLLRLVGWYIPDSGGWSSDSGTTGWCHAWLWKGRFQTWAGSMIPHQPWSMIYVIGHNDQWFMITINDQW